MSETISKTILSIETASEFCSIALLKGDEIFTQSIGVPQQHSLSILSLIDAVLAQGQISLKQLDAIAVGQGPGSFTGVRLGISVAQGLCLGLEIPCIPVSSLAVLAFGAKLEAQKLGVNFIMASMDARMQEVYSGLYKLENNNIITIIDSFVQKPLDIKIDDKIIKDYNIINHSVIAIGTGWKVYPSELLESTGFKPAVILDSATPQAADLALLALKQLKMGNVCKPEECYPAYCRNQVV